MKKERIIALIIIIVLFVILISLCYFISINFRFSKINESLPISETEKSLQNNTNEFSEKKSDIEETNNELDNNLPKKENDLETGITLPDSKNDKNTTQSSNSVNNESNQNTNYQETKQENSNSNTTNKEQDNQNSEIKPNEPTDLEYAIKYQLEMGNPVTYINGKLLTVEECMSFGQTLIDNQDSSFVYQYECPFTKYETATAVGLLVSFLYDEQQYISKSYDEYKSIIK